MDEFLRVCPSCEGAGGWTIGNCEEGEWHYCLECLGRGEIEL